MKICNELETGFSMHLLDSFGVVISWEFPFS